MSAFTIAPVAITANVLKHDAGHVLPANVTNVNVQMTDSAGNTTPLAGSNWLTTVGNVTQWGVQRSVDSGVTWTWLLSQPLAFGSVDKHGNMPQLTLTASDLTASSGDQLRLAVLTDTNITLGAVITAT